MSGYSAARRRGLFCAAFRVTGKAERLALGAEMAALDEKLEWGWSEEFPGLEAVVRESVAKSARLVRRLSRLGGVASGVRVPHRQRGPTSSCSAVTPDVDRAAASTIDTHGAPPKQLGSR